MNTSALKHPEFRKLMTVRVLFTLAVQMQAVVIGWQVYERTQDPLYLGFIGLTEAVPALTLALFAGAWVDRGDAKRIYQGVIATSLLSALLLLGSTFDLQGPLLLLYSAAFLTGLARGFSSPALYSLIPRILPREALNVSSAWITLTIHLATLAGPALGGILFGQGGARVTYFAIVTALGLAWIRFQTVRTPLPAAQPMAREPLGRSIRAGVRFVFGDPLLISALTLDLFAVFFGGVTALLPLFAKDILAIGPEGLGWLRAAPAIGALTMTASLIRWPITRNAGQLLLGVVSGFGFCMIGFALSRNAWLSGLLLALGGGLDAVSMVVRASIVQLRSPPEMRGRVASVNAMFIGSSNELGAFESGLAARFLGAVPSVIFGGTMTILTVLLVAWRAPSLKSLHLDELGSR